MSAIEFAEWQAFYRLYPSAIQQNNVYLAQVAYFIAKTIDSKKSIKFKDFFIEFAPKEQMPEEDLCKVFKAWEEAYPDKFIRKKKKRRNLKHPE